MGGPGVIFSKGLLKQLKPKLRIVFINLCISGQKCFVISLIWKLAKVNVLTSSWPTMKILNSVDAFGDLPACHVQKHRMQIVITFTKITRRLTKKRKLVTVTTGKNEHGSLSWTFRQWVMDHDVISICPDHKRLTRASVTLGIVAYYKAYGFSRA